MQKLIDALDKKGYYIWDDFMSATQVEQLKSCLPENWKQACIGRNDEVMRAASIRSDKIHWLAPNLGEPPSSSVQLSFI